MKHHHSSFTVACAHALGSCADLQVQVCHCGAVKVPMTDIWLEPGANGGARSSPKWFTLTEAAHALGLSDRCMEKLIAGRLIRGEKLNYRGKSQWVFRPEALERFRTRMCLRRAEP